MFSSNHALQYLTYPSQVVGKACKPIPVLLLTALVRRKRYSLTKYGCVILLVTGVAIFLYNPTEEDRTQVIFVVNK
jgi:UDP-galactose transporter B1